MDALTWLAVAVGAGLSLLALVDAFLTVLHPDIDGPVTGRLQLGVWTSFMAFERRRQQGRRLMALAGPVMLGLTFVTWITMLTVGVGLIVWPFIDSSYRSEPDLGPLGFDDALYYSGTTVAVLGHGDITPLTPLAQLLAVLASLCGFALMTGSLAYLVEVLASLHERVRMALRIRSDIDGEFDGAVLLARWTADEELSDLRGRLEGWAGLLRDAQQQLQRFPLAALCFRSHDADGDPEPAVRAAAEVAMASRLLSVDERFRRLRGASVALDHAVTRFMVITGNQYLGSEVADRLDVVEPTVDDRRHVDDLSRRLCSHFEISAPIGGVETAVELACRSRLFLEAFHHLTSSEVGEVGDTEASAPPDEPSVSRAPQ